MLLCVDIGNSTVGFCVFPHPGAGQGAAASRTLISVSTGGDYTAKLKAELRGVNAAILSSVVPAETPRVIAAIEEVFGVTAEILTHEADTGMRLDVQGPETLGTDRIAECAGALALYGIAEAPLAVIGCGTATTVNFIHHDEHGAAVFSGGAILPGPALMARSLNRGTAALPLIDLSPPFLSPIGRSTQEALRSGIIYGSAGAVRGIIERAEAERSVRYRLVLTGGNAGLFGSLLQTNVSASPVYIEPLLVFIGLRAVYERLQG